MDLTAMGIVLALTALVFVGLIGVEWVSTGRRSPRNWKVKSTLIKTSTLEEGDPMNQTTADPTLTGGFDAKRTVLTLIALFTGSAATIFMLLLASSNAMLIQGLTEMPKFINSMHSFAKLYVPLVWLPSLAVLIGVAWYGQQRFPALANRIWAGLGAGAVATLALDFFRQMGVMHGWLATDTPIMFGKMILGPQAGVMSVLFVGVIYHFLNGASFGVFYTLVWGKARWWWGLVWALVVEVGMMTAPPMAPLFGPFGSKTGGPAFFLITLAAHIGFGIVLGLLAQHWVKHKGSIFALFTGREQLVSP